MKFTHYTVEENASIYIDNVGEHTGETLAFHLEENALLQLRSVTIGVNLAPSENAGLTSEDGADITITNIAATSVQSTVFAVDSTSALTYIARPDQTALMSETYFYYMDTHQSGGLINVILPTRSENTPSFYVSALKAGDEFKVQFQDDDEVPFAPDYVEATKNDDGSGSLDLYVQQGNRYILGAHIDLIKIDPDAEIELSPDGKVSIACYVRDTLITTPDGEKPVQNLQEGDYVLNAHGERARVKWVGHRTMYASRISPKNAINAFPICITAGALGHDVPRRDLYVSPGHHMYFDGLLIPAVLLVNGRTITQDFTIRSFEYFHVELDHFDIMLAEGAPAESYVDTGNRSMFQNVDVTTLDANFGQPIGRQPIDGMEIVRHGPKLEALRKRLINRAASLTRSNRVYDTNLHLEIDGLIVFPIDPEHPTGVLRFVLPENSSLNDVKIRSRSSIVRDTAYKGQRDLRRVGVGISGITIKDSRGTRPIDLLDGRLMGFHAAQDVSGTAMRWTKGSATIPAEVLDSIGPAILELHILRTYSYWDRPARHAA